MFPDARFVCCHRERTAEEKNRAREATNNRSVLIVLFNLQTVLNFSNYQAAKQTEASRQELLRLTLWGVVSNLREDLVHLLHEHI